MELKIKARLDQVDELEELVSLIKDIEEDYNCNCILLEVEIERK